MGAAARSRTPVEVASGIRRTRSTPPKRTRMTARELVVAFYADIWDRGNLSRIPALLREDFTFRGSTRRRAEGARRVRGVRQDGARCARGRCDILDLVVEERRAFARMRFSGRHVGEFLGFRASGKELEWMGAALFTLGDDGRASDLWVLGDVESLRARLRANAAAEIG